MLGTTKHDAKPMLETPKAANETLQEGMKQSSEIGDTHATQEMEALLQSINI